MISISALSKEYVNQVKVLEQVNLNIERGEFLYLVGGTGAGKTTFLKLLATEDAPSGGRISLFGYDLSEISPSVLRAIRQSIGYIPQTLQLISDMSVYDNLLMSLQTAGKRIHARDWNAKINDLLEVLGLSKRKDTPCRLLSGGEAQRVAVARALVRSPEIIIADEATGSQDRKFTWLLLDLLMKANLKGTTVIFATHDREIVRKVKKRCAILREGRVSFEDGLCFY